MKNTNDSEIAVNQAPLRIGLIGAGQMSQQHARAIARLPGLATVTAVADRDVAAVEAIRRIHPNASCHSSLRELLASTAVDVVHICTPPETHEALTQQALEAGRHAYVEKPFVGNRAAAARPPDIQRFTLPTPTGPFALGRAIYACATF